MTRSKRRLSKSEWLTKALNLINKEGPSCLKLRNLTQKLGVTTGSFYWHFESTEEFVKDVLLFWEAEYSLIIKSLLDKIDKEQSPQDRLRSIISFVLSNDYNQFEIGMRAWAAGDKTVAEVVQRGDQWREAVLVNLFSEMGFSGTELTIRVQNCLAFLNFQNSMYLDTAKEAECTEEYLAHLTSFYTQD